MLGLITEYNPFHNGHILHIKKSKEKTKEDNVIVVMSGNFTQRGEPAIMDKFLRAKIALLNGADIVIELPTYFATSSAEFFAIGAIDLLNKTGVVNKICFGAEDEDLSKFLNIAKILANETEEFKNILNINLKKGLTFPKARLNALSYILKEDLDYLKQPNNILVLEYLKAIIKLNANITPFAIKREYAPFHSTDIFGNIASATALRKAFYNNTKSIYNCIPQNSIYLIQNIKNIPYLNDYSPILSYILKTANIDYLKNISEMQEGLENKILKNANILLISNLINAIQSKRYTETKLQRLILNIIIQKTKEDDIFFKNNLNSYIKVLGFKKASSYILKKMHKEAKVPIILNLKNAKNILDNKSLKYLNRDIKTNDIYHIKNNKPINYEYLQPLVII